MRSTVLIRVAAILLALGLEPMSAAAAPPGGPPTLQRNGAIKIAGRDLRCGQVRNRLDNRLPSEGAAAPGILVLNPRLITRMPETVRLFVFYHECGHHNVGESELGADCWAVGKGVSEGWLDRASLRQVCRSFGNMPETATHPSSRRRCRNLDVCFNRAVVRLPKKAPPQESIEAAASTPPNPSTTTAPANVAPKLISGPRLIGAGSVSPAAAEPPAGESRAEGATPARALR